MVHVISTFSLIKFHKIYTICKTPKSDGQSEVRMSALNPDGLPRQSLMLSDMFVMSHHGNVIGDIAAIYSKWRIEGEMKIKSK